MKFSVALALILLLACSAFAQDQQEEQDSRFTYDKPINIDFQKEEEPINTKKPKKPKKKVFYGIKTKKGFTRKGFGDRVTYELFYYLKKAEKPQTFVRDVYYYNFIRKEIVAVRPEKFDPTKGVLLHGPYEKRQGSIVLEKGIYYKGTKHGRWVQYNRDSILLDKTKYFKGWPKDSEVSYYDPMERKKMKEIIPIEFGEKEGFYYRFYEDGKLAVMGEYHWDQKVGDWTEYYPNNKRKRIITYPSAKDPFDKNVRPYIKVEWSSETGKEIYRNNKRLN